MANKPQPKPINERRNVYVPELHWRKWRADAISAGLSISEYIVATMSKALKVRP
jgi:hypothetical protein